MFEINGKTWRVVAASRHHPMLTRSDGTLAIGACDEFSSTIYISDEIDEQVMKRVLCHEITHAAMFSYNISLSWQQEELLADLMATYGQEIVVIANVVFKLIKENWA